MIRLFAVHPTAANILMIAFLALGLLALPNLQRDTFPLVAPSNVEVRIAYPGATPAEVERGICAVVEQSLRTVDNLNELACLSRENTAVITAEIVENADMTRFHNDIKAAVEGLSGLPDKSDDPVTRVIERVASVASIAVTGPDDPQVLHAYSEGLADRLRADPFISNVEVNGFSEREISIEIGALALERVGLDIAQVSAVLARHSLDLPAGTLQGLDGDVAIRFLGEKRSPAELALIPLAGTETGGVVLLGDVSTIRLGFDDPSQAAYFNNRRAAIIAVSKTASQDALRVKAALDRQLVTARAEAQGNIELAISQDSTGNIRDRLRIVGENGLQGLVMVLVVMWLFFGFRLSFWVAMGLPVSFLGAVFAMQLLGFTINMMTMVALLVAVGLLMDDAIVISENIVRRREAGESPRDAAVNGVFQVGPGVFASFLTTAMIVGPLGSMSGNIGAILKYIPIVLLLTLAISLVEAFLILPAHMRHSLDRAPKLSRVSQAVNGGFAKFRDGVIVPLAGLALRFRYATLGIAVFLVLFSLAPFTGGFIKFQSFPQLESDTVEARLLLAEGSPLILTEMRVAKVVKALEQMNDELTLDQPNAQTLVQSYTITYGVNTDAAGTGTHMATVSAKLLPAGSRTSSVAEILDRWKKLAGRLPDMAAFRITDKERGAGGKPIDILVQGDDLVALATTAKEMRRFFRNFSGVRDVTYDLRPGKPEYLVQLNTVTANTLGITPHALAAELRAGFRGDSAVRFVDDYGEVNVVARLAASDRMTREDILDLRIASAQGALVPLSAVATVTQSRGFAAVNRVDGQRSVRVQGSINPAIANARELMAALKADYLPTLASKRPGVSVSILGEAEDAATTGNSLARNIAVGMAGVFLLLAFYLKSFIRPVAVLAAIPLSLVGVMWGHMALGLQISLPSLVGLATLAGVVVNDSILLVNFIDDKMQQGVDVLEAGREAVRDRFRAIFLTSLTTVVGLGPLLLEQSTQAQFLRPIVASLAFGLTAATFLALFVTPVVIAVLHDFSRLRSGETNLGE
jgi:multidrug efflux pump subunit AcrB